VVGSGWAFVAPRCGGCHPGPGWAVTTALTSTETIDITDERTERVTFSPIGSPPDLLQISEGSLITTFIYKTREYFGGETLWT